jgi:hypothetical protein
MDKFLLAGVLSLVYCDVMYGYTLHEVMEMVNVGELDMFLRFLLAMALFSLVAVLDTNMRWIGLLGFIPLLSAIFRFCPIYALMHTRSCKEEDVHGIPMGPSIGH